MSPFKSSSSSSVNNKEEYEIEAKPVKNNFHSCDQNSNQNSFKSAAVESSIIFSENLLEREKMSRIKNDKKLDSSLETNCSGNGGGGVPDYVRVLMVTDVNGRTKQLHVPAALDLHRPKRPRTTFTDKQVEMLELEFQNNHFVSEGKRQRLSAYLNLSQTQIKVWYQNRRSKCHRLGCNHHQQQQQGTGSRFSSSFSSSSPIFQPSSSSFSTSDDERHTSWTPARRLDRFPGEFHHHHQYEYHYQTKEEAMTAAAAATTATATAVVAAAAGATMKMKTKEKLVSETSHGFHPWSPELVQFPSPFLLLPPPKIQIWSSSISLPAPVPTTLPPLPPAPPYYPQPSPQLT